MPVNLHKHIQMLNTKHDSIYQPLFFRINNINEHQAFETFLLSTHAPTLHDTIEEQLRELIKSRYPKQALTPNDYSALIAAHLNDTDLLTYGVWVYYPWSHKLVHILDEEEFIEVRTNRNKYKITTEEQKLLAKKKIGIIGLSVGQSIALTCAMERTCGELRLADFDTIELSNLNRIRTGLGNLGINKAILVAREIAEIDPYLKVNVFTEGLTLDNMNDFFVKNGKLDLLIEVCDGLEIKIQSRFMARSFKIPVLMDTNDRGMLDVERFDLEPNRPVLHGLIGDIDPVKLSFPSVQEKVPFVMKIVDSQRSSKRGRASLLEVEESITSWPQLASSVVLGGAVTTDVTRRILLGQFNASGRFYVDLEEIISDKNHELLPKTDIPRINPHLPLSKDDMQNSIARAALADEYHSVHLQKEELHEIVQAAAAAPSTGNDQPWKWYYHQKKLYLFHEQCRSFSFGDYQKIASYLTFGAVYENLVLAAHKLHLEVIGHLFPLGYEDSLVCTFDFTSKQEGAEAHLCDDLADFIYLRNTNRNLAPKKEINPEILHDLKTITESIEGAHLSWLTDPEKIMAIGKIVGTFDRLRLLNQYGHDDFINREIRWTAQDVEHTKDGIDVLSLGLSPSHVSALEVIKDYNVLAFLKQLKKGTFVETATLRSIKLASAIGLITMERASPENYIQGGRALERLWLMSEKHQLALHPIISPLYFFPRIEGAMETGLSQEEMAETKAEKLKFMELFQIDAEQAGVFLFKLSYAERPSIKSLRLPVEDILYCS